MRGLCARLIVTFFFTPESPSILYFCTMIVGKKKCIKRMRLYIETKKICREKDEEEMYSACREPLAVFLFCLDFDSFRCQSTSCKRAGRGCSPRTIPWKEAVSYVACAGERDDRSREKIGGSRKRRLERGEKFSAEKTTICRRVKKKKRERKERKTECN